MVLFYAKTSDGNNVPFFFFPTISAQTLRNEGKRVFTNVSFHFGDLECGVHFINDAEFKKGSLNNVADEVTKCLKDAIDKVED